MAKTAHDDVLDALLEAVADNGTRICLCNAQPTTYTQAITTYKLADHTLVAGDGNGDYTIADGGVSGRKVTVTAQTSVTVDSSGTGTYVAIVDVANTKLLFVTTCTSQSVTAGNTVTLNSWAINIGDPT